MCRKLIIAIAVLSFALAGTTFAATANLRVSGDLGVQTGARDLSNDSNNFAFSQMRLRIDADLTEGVSAVVSLLNERIWGEEDAGDGNGSTEITLDLGYVELKEFIYDPLTLIVGRQNLRYGNALIVGDPDTNQVASGEVPTAIADLSMRKSFDAVRGILDFAPWTIDLIYAKVAENTLSERDDTTLYGFNAAYDWSSYNGITEIYLFNEQGSLAARVDEDEDNVLTIGARTQFDLNDNLTLGMEAAHQSGDYSASAPDGATDVRNAWAAIANAEYKFLNDYNTKVGASYTYLSGNDDTRNAWDPLYEDQTPGEIINILLTNSNVQLISISGSMMPREDITLGLVYTHARLNAQLGVAELSPTGVVFGNTYLMKDEKEFGNEVDLSAIYDYTEDVQLNLNAAWFMPGDAFAGSNDNSAYSVRGGLVVNF